ncbi:MAG: GTPase ObgE [Waddliaceae bacterium]|nr:GTPase ObgE [Waddliaceae bacterium]
MFTDKVVLKLEAGKGGNGVVAWNREKYIPKGGPAGGDGGKGGSVIIRADAQIHSLEWYRHKKIIQAENGQSGGSNCCRGRNGKTIELKVPCGTLIKDPSSGEILMDMVDDGQTWEICRGGTGGKGNVHFKTPTNRAPTKCTPGRDGEEISVEFELKLIADVGFVGFPNAGKSTLISKLAKVRVKIAPYPFTTLRPNLGIVEFADFSRILIADIPGIIRGAHENKGLGFEFLRHIERSQVLIFVVDLSGIDGRDPLEDFHTLRNELRNYSEEVANKPFLVAVNKMDEELAQENYERFIKECSVEEEKIFSMSALLGEGTDTFLESMRELVQKDGKRF